MRCRAEDIDDPPQCNHRPGKLRQVLKESYVAPQGHASEQNLACPQPKGQYDGQAEHEFQGGPQHSHQTDQSQTARDVLTVGAFESVYFCLLLHVSANYAGSGKVFLDPRGYVGEHGLNSFKALMDLLSEILHHDTHDR